MGKQKVCRICISVISCIVCIAYIVYIFRSCNQAPPTIKEGEFPFRFVYEMDGERYEIEDIVVCQYRGISGIYSNVRAWSTTLKSGEENIRILADENVYSILSPNRLNSRISIYLHYGRSTYYMGDNMNAGSITDEKPSLRYSEVYHSPPNKIHHKTTPLTEKQLEEHFGIKILEFEFSEPIRNTFKAE